VVSSADWKFSTESCTDCCKSGIKEDWLLLLKWVVTVGVTGSNQSPIKTEPTSKVRVASLSKR
jgi:hypothetical protein